MKFLKYLCLLMIVPGVVYAKCGDTDKYGWQEVDNGYTYRMEVPNGWLTTYKNGYGSTNVFIPDEHHTWQLKC